jgi:hypothetical protein
VDGLNSIYKFKTRFGLPTGKNFGNPMGSVDEKPLEEGMPMARMATLTG